MGTRYTKKQILRKKKLLPVSLRNKIRESTLQVFRERLKSPGKGGALLVGNSTNQAEDCLVTAAPTEKDNGSALTPCSVKDPAPQETVNNSDSSLQSMAKRKRIRTKRKNLQRNQYKNTGCLKKYISQMTKINNMVSCNSTSRRIRSPEKKISVIAENRITKYLGIFNRGRKSDRIARVCPPIPKSVQDKADSDLKKILNITSHPRDVITIIESDDSGQHSHHGNKEMRQSAMTTQFSQKAMTTTTEGTTDTSNHLPEEKDVLPQQIPYKEVAEDLLSTLHEKKKLFNQDLRLTVSTQLYNLLRQSIQHSPVSKREAATKCNRATSEATPPSALNREKSLPPSTQHGYRKYPCIEQIYMDACPQDDGKYLLMKNDYVINIDEENMNGGGGSSSKKRIYQAGSILPSRGRGSRHDDDEEGNSSSIRSSNSKAYSCYLDPRKYLRAQPESFKSVKGGCVPWDKGGLNPEFGIEKIWKWKRLVADDIGLDYEGGQSYEHMETVGGGGSGNHGHQCTEAAGIFSVYSQKFTEVGCYPEQGSEEGSCYPCHLHQPIETDSYSQQSTAVCSSPYHLHKSTEADSYLERCTKTEEHPRHTHIGCTTEAPDFLQYLEQTNQGTISPESITTTVNYKLPKFKWNNTIFKASTPDSDSSPFWLLSESYLPPLPTKPSLDNVASPPGKFYPRKLY